MKNKINNTKIGFMVTGLLTLLPLVVGAEPKTLKTMATLITEYLNIGLMLIISLAVVVFVWNVFKYFFVETDRKEAGMYVMYSVIGFFIIFSFWGLVAILRNSLDLDDQAPQSFINGQFINKPVNTNNSPVKPSPNVYGGQNP
jgi:hypothetical protein